MRTLISVSTIGLCFALAGTCRVAGGDEKPNPEPKTSSVKHRAAEEKLLERVVHFSDDDIRFRTAEGITVFVDPVSAPKAEAVVRSGMVKPDLILITHSHGDHFQPAVLQQYVSLNSKVVLAGPADVVRAAGAKGIKASVVTPGKSYTLAGISFNAVPACFLEGNSHPRANQWVGYVLRLDGANYYVTGDTEPLPEMAKLKVDVLFPLLYGCGGNLDHATRMAELTGARVVVPVHTGGQEATIKKYLAGLPRETRSAYYQDARLIVSR